MIPDEDLKVELDDPRMGLGGQHCGGAYNGIRVEHLPTGLVAICRTERSQHMNRQICLDMILSALTHPNFRG